jgi:hypothetical protein
VKYLVTGLTASCTKVTARLVALNVGLTEEIDEWDGRWDIENENDLVSHRSIPHGHRKLGGSRYLNAKTAWEYDCVIVATRDSNCSLRSSIKDHQPDVKLALLEHEKGIEVIKSIADLHPNVHFFSYETAQLLQDAYTDHFFSRIGIDNPQHTEFKNINKKYIGSI